MRVIQIILESTFCKNERSKENGQKRAAKNWRSGAKPDPEQTGPEQYTG